MLVARTRALPPGLGHVAWRGVAVSVAALLAVAGDAAAAATLPAPWDAWAQQMELSVTGLAATPATPLPVETTWRSSPTR